MALVRCETCGQPKGRTRKYIRERNPIGYPDTAVICGSRSCNNPGKVWLEAYEWRQYQTGTRVFDVYGMIWLVNMYGPTASSSNVASI